MKINQIYKACTKNKYIILRDNNNSLVGINCAIHKMKRFKGIEVNNGKSNFQSYYPCSFQEYIRLKIPFYSLATLSVNRSLNQSLKNFPIKTNIIYNL